MRTVLPAAKSVPSTVETLMRSFDSSEWNVPEVPSAHESLIVFGWLGSGPTVPRPCSKDGPESHEIETVEQRGACSVASNVAVAPPPTVLATTLTVSFAVAAPSETVSWKTYVAAVVRVALAVAWFALLIVTDGPETCVQANVRGEGPASGSLPLPARVTEAPAFTAWSGPAFAVGGRLPPPPGVTWKFAFETSKKMFPTASTLMRAVVVVPAGITTACEPSFGVLATSTVGNDVPPFVDSRMRTFAAPTGATAVFATSQVTVCVEPAGQLTFVLGAVTTNGPASAREVTVVVSAEKPPPPERLSRAVTRKVMVRVVVGSDSPSVDVLLRMSDSFGKVREGDVVGLNDRKIGRLPLSVLGGEAVPRSYCSQA